MSSEGRQWDELEETDEEAMRNRGTITVFEQTKETEYHDVGDRYFSLGYDTKRHIIDEEKEDFVSVAVPLAHIELPEPITEDELTEWTNSDLGKLALSRFWDGLDHDDVLTEWGEERL